MKGKLKKTPIAFTKLIVVIVIKYILDRPLTSSMLKTRIQEHQRALRIEDPNSQIYQHVLETDHSINFNSPKMIMTGIFSKIDRPLDFNETFVNSSVLNVVSINDTRFLRKSLFKKLL